MLRKVLKSSILTLISIFSWLWHYDVLIAIWHHNVYWLEIFWQRLSHKTNILLEKPFNKAIISGIYIIYFQFRLKLISESDSVIFIICNQYFTITAFNEADIKVIWTVIYRWTHLITLYGHRKKNGENVLLIIRRRIIIKIIW